MSESISLSSSSLAYAQTPRLAVADQDDKPVPSTPDDLLAKSQAEFAAGERRMKVAELQGIASKKKALEALHLLQQRVAEAEARKLANPPVPAKVLEGMEAARALTLAKKIAQESGVHFPPHIRETASSSATTNTPTRPTATAASPAATRTCIRPSNGRW
ncbi:MAG: hypothetical protein NVV74_22440 [Magnetospirillum sp.]|nr:hypothetical protein [Magnetospirillum sp.]